MSEQDRNESELRRASVDVAWRLTAYDQYGGERARALAALRRRAPGAERETYARYLSAALVLVAACRRAMKEHVGDYYHVRGSYDFSPLYPELSAHVEAFGAGEVDAVLAISLLYDHLK